MLLRDLNTRTELTTASNQNCWLQLWKLSISQTLMISKEPHPSPVLPVSLFLSLHLELIDGTPTLKINHGSGTVVLQLPGNVNVADRRWHRLDVRSNSKVGRFTYLTPATIYLANKLRAYSHLGSSVWKTCFVLFFQFHGFITKVQKCFPALKSVIFK